MPGSPKIPASDVFRLPDQEQGDSRLIIRIFRVRARRGRASDLERVVRERGVPNIARREGLLSLFLGRPDGGDDHDLVLVSVWQDLDAIRAFKGDAWREARLLPEELELSESASVWHVLGESVGKDPHSA